MTQHKHFSVISIIVGWLLLPASVYATSWEVDAFMQKLSLVLENTPPPAVKDIIPGYRKGATKSPGIAIANLENESGNDGDWGRAIGEILRWDLAYGYRAALRGADFLNYTLDSFSAGLKRPEMGRSLSGAERVARRTGLDHTLSGRVGVAKDRYDLVLELRRVGQPGPMATYHHSGMLAELPIALDSVVPKLCQALQVVLCEPQLTRAKQIGASQLQKLATALAVYPETPEEDRNAPRLKLWDDGVQTPFTAVYRMRYLESNNTYEYKKKLEDAGGTFADEHGVEFSLARLAPFRDGLLEAKRQEVTRQIIKHPDDPIPMLVLADTLCDGGNALAGIALAAEAVRRWPDHYRSWWSMGYALIMYGWELRGSSYWKEVPETGQQLYPQLKALGAIAADRALAIHPDSAGLWAIKMFSISAYSTEFMMAYEKAIELDPYHRWTYEMALNHTQPKWGGSVSEQAKVWAQAKSRIRDEVWLNRMRQLYVDEQAFGFLMMGSKDWSKYLPFIVAFGLAVLAVGFWLGRRRNR